ncbi:hypothetical protein NA78x_000254 [Anatilimnocola sp. NA78]|uniref:hypothetical protein n=1 Tax=Anatilimnocola sp. NA78 TaxID=3415683 RepID=UPI003CE4FDF5
MKRFAFGLVAALGLALVGCEKSVNNAVQDVNEAEKEKMENVKEEMRDVQDAAIEGEKKVLDEKRDLEDAKKAELEKNGINPAPAPGPIAP